MNISEHFLYSSNKDILSGGKPMLTRRAVVIHFTAGATAKSSINFWKEPEQKSKDIGAHLIIDRDGSVTQCRAFNKTISHAGISKWVDPKTGKKYTMCNGFTIGIELANAGNNEEVIKIAKKLPHFAGTIRMKHRNGGLIQIWELFPKKLLDNCFEVVKELVEKYNLDDITGHDCISPNRKNDPGPAFPMLELRQLCGFPGLPVVHW